jgi:predicted CXXCH cytochrome family protein
VFVLLADGGTGRSPKGQDRMSSGSSTIRAKYKIATVVWAVLWPSMQRESSAQSGTEHPYLDPRNLESRTCLKCHPDKVEGRFVHATGRATCETCHRVSSEGRRTAVTYAERGAGLCSSCHVTKQSAGLHLPYKLGQCLVCHNPHSSPFAGQVRATVRTLCLSCHGKGSPDVQVDREAKQVSLLGGRTVDLLSYERAQKVAEQHGEPGQPAGAGCLSCHAPHGGSNPKLSNAGGRP